MRVKSMRGRDLDMGALIAKNATKKALGNANRNARGDLLGPNGQIIKRHEDTLAEYHRASPNAVKRMPLSDLRGEAVSPAEAVAASRAQAKAAQEAAQKAQAVLEHHQAAAQNHSKRKLVDPD